MKPLPPLVLLTLVCLASSCSKRSTHAAAASGSAAAETPAASYCLPASSAWSEDEYTQWMTRAELQFFQEQNPRGQYFAHVEGRNNASLSEFRAVRKPLPSEQYVEAAVFWGLNDKDVFDTELRLLRAGFVRKSMQVFVDASGAALHQLVWLKPIGTPPAPPQDANPGPLEPPPANPIAIATDTADTADTATATATATADTADTSPAVEPTTPAPTDASPPEAKPPVALVVPRKEARPAAEPEAAGPKKFVTYTVVQGDVVEKIARRYHTTVEAILAANNLKNDSLQIGQKLKIPKK